VRSIAKLIERKFPKLAVRLKLIKHRTGQWRKASMHLRDAWKNLNHMEWRARRDMFVLEAELIFQYHKIEKGLCMPPPRRFFGVEPAKKTVALIYEWERCGGDKSAPAYLGAIEAMRSYAQSLELYPPPTDVASWMQPMLDRLLANRPKAPPEFDTPMKPTVPAPTSAEVFERLMHARRSVRHYTSEVVPLALIQHCISIAQMSPSACNRQPWHVHVYTKADQIRSMLKLQNGNTGFGHQLSTLLVVTADRRSFFDASERNEPFVDGGLFAMSLILALQSHGVASCCLNWCVDTEKDHQAHVSGGISDGEAIIMYLAIGYADATALVPRSARKATSSAMAVH
jgi:nitroreductase